MTVKEYKKYYKELNKDSRKNKNWKKNWKFLLQYNYEWDDAFLIDIIVHKLRLMYEYFNDRSKVYMVEKQRLEIVNSIKRALDLGEKIRIDDFDEESENFMKKHTIVSTEKENNSCIIKWDSEENEKFYLSIVKKEDKFRRKVIKDFFNTIRDNFENWWD